jgi:hypothetical protein
MFFLTIQAYRELIRFNFCVARNDFASLYAEVRACRVDKNHSRQEARQEIPTAVDRASIWFWKEVSCLHRSAATACLLKRYGVPAQLVIGAQLMPFRAHAWIEVEGKVVNDKPYVSEIYAVLDRC